MNILYSCNNAYISQTGISIISLLENNRTAKDITIYFVSKDVSIDNVNLLKAICLRYGRSLINIPFEEIAYDLKLTHTGRHIETVYTKIFISRIKDVKKCIYLDSDTIIIDSLDELWNIDLSNVYLAAVETYTDKYRSLLNMKPQSPFFNDGMTLINVEYCRQNHLISRALLLIDKYSGNPPVLSEGVLNNICQDQVKIISMKYNLMSGLYQLGISNPKYLSSLTSYTVVDIKTSCYHPVIIHYLCGYYNRPWSKNCSHPLKHFYLKYKDLSPWKEQALDDNVLPFYLRIYKYIGVLIGFDNLMRLSHLKRYIKK